MILNPIGRQEVRQEAIKQLAPFLPAHKTYVEPFLSSMFFKKEPSMVEVVSELNGEILNFFKQVQSKFHLLVEELRKISYSRKIFKDARVINTFPDLFSPLQRASALYILANQSKNGKEWFKETKVNCAKAFLKQTEKCFTGIGLKKRFDSVIIECKKALDCLKEYNLEDALFFIQVPFVVEPSHFSWLDYEMLLAQLKEVKGKFVFCSYPTKQLELAMENCEWSCLKLPLPSGKEEWVVANFALAPALFELVLKS